MSSPWESSTRDKTAGSSTTSVWGGSGSSTSESTSNWGNFSASGASAWDPSASAPAQVDSAAYQPPAPLRDATYSQFGPATWLPAWGALAATVLAVLFAVLAWLATTPGQRIMWGVTSYLLGAVLVSILANVQRSVDKNARARGQSLGTQLGMLGEQLAKACMWIGLLAAIAAVIPVATELAKR